MPELVDPFDDPNFVASRAGPVSAPSAGGLIDPLDDPNFQIGQPRNPAPRGTVPPVEPEERGIIGQAADLVTGAGGETAATAGRGEFDLPFEFSGRQFKTALGLMTTFDPKGQVAILARNYPDLQFLEDEKGNIIVDGSAYDGGIGVLNLPGISTRDLLQAGFQVAAFTPVGRAASATAGVAGNVLRVGAASAVGQAAQDVVSQATGRTEDIAAGNIRKADVGLAATAGGGFQALFQSLARGIPALRQRIQASGITDEIRATVRQAAVRLGMSADDVTDDVINGLVSETRTSVAPDELLAIGGEREFGIPLTAGQRSMDDAALSIEDSARVGLRGEGAQRIMRGFERERQIPAVNQARERLESTISRGREPLTRGSQAGAAVREAVPRAEAAAKAIVDDAYEVVEDAALTPGGFQFLTRATRQSIDGLEFIRSPELTPATEALRNRLGVLEQSLGVVGEGAERTLTSVHMRQLDGVRRSLLAFEKAAANPTDRRNITVMRQAFDDWLDDAVTGALFEGDTASLESLKTARGLFREYARKFRESPGRTRGGKTIPDPQGRFIERLVADNPTDEQTINALFGAANFSNTAGSKMAQRFKAILGADSDAWAQVRQAAFRRLIKTNVINGEEVVSGSKTLTAIRQAMEKNRSLMGELFSDSELSLLRRFAVQVKRTQPDLVRSRENPSGTAQKGIKALADIVRRAAGVFAASGEPALLMGSTGVSVARGVRSTAQARAAVRPFERIIARPGVVGAATGLGVEVGQQE